MCIAVAGMERELVSSEFKESRVCFDSLVDEILLDLCFEYHWQAKTGLTDRLHQENDESSITFVTSPLIICNICHLQVSGYRYAQHLEKCLNGNKRSASTRKKQSTTINSSTNTPSSISSLQEQPLVARKKPRFSYGSLTVRIKLKNGVPTPNQRRRTVPSMVFINYSLARNGTRTPPLITNGDNHDYNEVNGDVVDVDDEDNDDMDESDPRPSI